MTKLPSAGPSTNTSTNYRTRPYGIKGGRTNRGGKHWNKHVNRPLDAWVHDFCAARNAAAHGPANGEKGSIWPRHNHLIFSAWLLPLIVKKLLAQAGLYEFTAEDKVARAGFEVFLAHDLLASPTRMRTRFGGK
ncbi:MAG: hypothetical protein ACRC1I_04425 [Pseudomonas proteolytica]|uniref:hypothetical protein n=1 Tax=Pseudomonas proteolytica TaxID=219574 RepID=UPI003F3D1CC9